MEKDMPGTSKQKETVVVLDRVNLRQEKLLHIITFKNKGWGMALQCWSTGLAS
jgi:hypothetical protein